MPPARFCMRLLLRTSISHSDDSYYGGDAGTTLMSLILKSAAASASQRAAAASSATRAKQLARRCVQQHQYHPHSAASHPQAGPSTFEDHPSSSTSTAVSSTSNHRTTRQHAWPYRFGVLSKKPTFDKGATAHPTKSALRPQPILTKDPVTQNKGEEFVPSYVDYDDVYEDFVDESSTIAAALSEEVVSNLAAIEDPVQEKPKRATRKAARQQTLPDEDHLAFGRRQSRRAASKTILNGGMTQQDKVARKIHLETIALRQGVTAAKEETKRIRREDAARRQKRKRYLLNLQPYIERNLRLIDLEAHEDQRQIEEQQSWSDAKLLSEGIMLTGLEGYWLQPQQGYGSGSMAEDSEAAVVGKTGKANGSTSNYMRTALLHRPGKAKLGWTRIQRGDQVTLRQDSAKEGEESSISLEHIATVRSINEYEVRLIFRDPPANLDLLSSATWRIDIAYNDTIEARLRNAVEAVAHDVDAARRGGVELSGTYLVDILQEAGRSSKQTEEGQTPIGEWIRQNRADRPEPDLQHLTESQRKAVNLMLNERLSLIQGPPGTGKTSTIVAAIRVLKQHYEIPHPILLTSHTNVAVDNLTQGCKEAGLHVVRAGPAMRVRESIADVTLEGRMEQHRLMKRLRDVESIRAATLHSLQARQNRSPGSDRVRDEQTMQRIQDDPQDDLRGFSLGEWDETDRAAQTSRPKKTSLSTAALQKRLSQMNQQAFLLRRQMEMDIFADADVVCCTALSIPLIRAIDFPIVFFDEATMATEPITLATITKGCQQLALIGDHKQLSPLIRSREAQEQDLGESMFERLMDRGDLKSVMLDTQHRMHPSLAVFSGQEFYDGKLLNGSATEQMQPLSSSYVPRKKQAEGNGSFLTFVHHEGRERLAKSKSLENQSEAELVVSIVADLLVRNPDLQGSDIAILTPYAGQRELLARSLMEVGSHLRKLFAQQLEKRGGVEAKARIRELGKLEVETIDGFEGREKRAIVFSMVRNNAGRTWGFLNEYKRWNVALTRARNGLWIVGSMPMLERMSIRQMQEERQQQQSLRPAVDGGIGKDADEEDGVKLLRPWRPENGQHAGFITRFAAHLRKHGNVVDAANVL